MAAGKSVPVRGRASRWGVGPLGLPESLDWRLVLDCSRARRVGLHAWGHILPHLSNVARRKLCFVQFPDDLFRRFYCGLAFGVAVLVLPLGRISEARLRQQAREQPGSRAATCP